MLASDNHNRAPRLWHHLDELASSSTRVLSDHRRADRRQARTTTKGLRIRAERDDDETGVKASDEGPAVLHLTRHDFHGGWNHTRPRRLHDQTSDEAYRRAVRCSRAPVH
jgi:hypothetical protein